jgi:transglutaminase-like putative cysteine protease
MTFLRDALRLLRFRGGWSGLPIFAIMTLIYPLSLQQADWVEVSSHFVLISVVGTIVGTAVGNSRMRSARAAIAAAAAGTLAVALFTVAASGDGPFLQRAVHLGVDVNTWLTQVLAGEAARGQSAFILFLGASVWSTAFVGAFALARTGRPWESILLTGACLTVNVSLALTPLLLDLVVFTLCALVLMVRLHIVMLQERWERRNIQPSGEMDWRVLRGGLTWTTVLVIMALVTPRVGAADALDTAFNVFENPYQHVETEWQRFFAGVSGPSRLRGVSFSDAIRLGQSPNLGESVVMTVESAQGHFWRAITYDFYDGQGWRSTAADRVDKVNSDQFAKREKLDVTFDVQQAFGGRLFSANEPLKVSIPAQFITGEDRSFSDGLRALDQRQAQSRYTVTSYVSAADKGSLRRAPTAIPDAVKRTYLQIPSTLPQRVRDLAHQIVAGKDNAYDKAEAIETYLRTTYHYAPVVRPPPPGQDPVDWFLFDLKEDFCEYFATSMAIMLREDGIPARMVEGFTSGTFDPDTGQYTVKQINAHAWVEAYFPGFGWIEFEPTPSETPFLRTDDATAAGADTSSGAATDPDAQSASDRLLRQDELGQSGDVSGSGDAASSSLPVDPTPLVAALGLLLVAALAFVARFEWRFRGLSPVEASWGRSSLLASYLGHRPRPSQTTYEYAAALGDAVPEVRAPIGALADARVRERYAPHGGADGDRETVEEAWWSIARALLGLIPQRVLSFVAGLIPKR